MPKDKNQFIDKPHDSAWKRGMHYLPVARSVFERYLPSEVKGLIDWSSMELKQTGYVDEIGRASSSDVLYGVETKVGAGYLYLLAEHQRTAVKYLPLRLWGYILRIIHDHVHQNNDHFPIVFPLVYYNGSVTPYPYSTDFWFYFKDSELAKKLMLSPFLLVDSNELDEPLPSHRWSNFLELLLKHMGRDSDFLNVVETLSSSGYFTYIEGQDGLSYLIDMIYWSLRETGISDLDRMREVFEKSLSGLGDRTMNLLERVRQEGLEKGLEAGIEKGREEGLEEGIEKGLEKGLREARCQVALNLLQLGQNPVTVSKVTGLSMEDLEQFKGSVGGVTAS